VKTSEAGIAFLKAREGLCPYISNDVGHPVIGYGHDLTQQEVSSGAYKNGITQDEADALLRQDLATRYEPTLNALLPPETNQNQYDACASFCYNEGVTGFATMIHHGLDQVPVQMPAWHYTHVNGVLVSDEGLVTRRALEVNLFTNPYS
jgi:GH24 family phage-related lysozyme (muramidase)